jgi:protein-tyrosine kinase
MNDVTPRRMTASLLERANDRFGFAPAPLPRPEPLSEAAEVRSAPARHLPESRPVTRLKGPERRGEIDRQRLAAAGMIVPGAPVTGLAEEFRIVKRSLLLSTGAEALSRRILVCSAQPAEGKSFSAVNLALSIAAEKDVQVLLIDADFAKAEVPGIFGLDPAGPGLLDLLADPSLDPEAVIIRTDVPQLSVLSAGTRTAEDTELLASDRLAQLLESLHAADQRRIIIFDSPPALAASPASTLAPQVGHVLLVVRADRTPESEVREAVMLLDACSDIQLMLNRSRFAPGGQRFGSYYGYGG